MKSVGMARLACRRWLYAHEGWYWDSGTWTIYQHAKRYLRRYAQRRKA